MISMHRRIISKKYKSILIVQAMMFILLILSLAVNDDKNLNAEILQDSALIMSIGYLSIMLFPIIILQKRMLGFVKKNVNGIFKNVKIYNSIFIGLFYLAIIGSVVFICSLIFNIDIIPIFFSLPGVMFLFALIEHK